MMSSSLADSEVLGWIGTLDPPQRAEVLATLVAERERSHRSALRARASRVQAIVVAILCVAFVGLLAATGREGPARGAERVEER